MKKDRWLITISYEDGKFVQKLEKGVQHGKEFNKINSLNTYLVVCYTNDKNKLDSLFEKMRLEIRKNIQNQINASKVIVRISEENIELYKKQLKSTESLIRDKKLERILQIK